MDCAREMRGTASIASPVMPRLASSLMSSSLRPGAMRQIRVAPERMRSRLALGGVSSVVTMSASQTSSPTMLAPASR